MCFAVIDLNALVHNIKYIRERNPNKKICGVVKANGYGHGSVRVAQAALNAGVDYLSVARPSEGAELRCAGVHAPILVMGGVTPRDVKVCLEHNLEFCVQSIHVLRALAEENVKAKIHIKIDSGMGRIGVCSTDEFMAMLDILKNNPQIQFVGLFTHFASADCDKDYTMLQIKNFKEYVTLSKDFQPMVHCANSAASMEGAFGDMLRLGIAMYGLSPSNIKDPALKPVMSLRANIVQIKKIVAGQSVSYGRTFVAKRDTLVASVPMGYGDGYFRILSNCAEMLVRGRRANIIGRVCMDQIMLDVTHIPDVTLFDEVVALGSQGQEEISAEELAKRASTINYEIVTAIKPRVERIYVEGNA